MKRALWVVLIVLGLVWTGLAWLFWALAGSGGRAVVALTRGVGLDPSQTQWLADGLAMAGGLAQWLVVLCWLLGIAALLVTGWLAGEAQKSLDAMADANRRDGILYGGPEIDGEVRFRKVSQSGVTGGKHD